MSAATILLVDDSPVNLSVLRSLLGKDDHEVIAADTAEAAIDLVRGNPTFDLILLDVSMPDMDGVEVCRELKEDPATMHIPVVLISGVRTDDASVRRGLEAGADGYLVKPIEDVALRAWVRATLRISQLQRELAAHAPPAPASNNAVLRMFTKLCHNVNNPLQALYASADMLALRFADDLENRKLVAEILAQAERVAQIVARASYAAKQRLGE
ncbi:MAG TPA: response regulator [Candidatus Hydrogenedentes bacterium]|nr:response regulator [Candidatus Hydrogenedentota bacterium]